MHNFSIAQRVRLPILTVLSAALLLGAWAAPAAAQYITTNRTVAGGNPLNGTYSQGVAVGASAIINGVVTRVPDLRVDIVAPALFNWTDATGGTFSVFSNSVLTITGGNFAPVSSFLGVGRMSLFDTSRADISGGTLKQLVVNGTAAGSAGASVTISGGTLQSSSGQGVSVQRGTLEISGGSIQRGIAGITGSIITISGGTVLAAAGGPAINVAFDSALTMTGGTVTAGPGGNAAWGVNLSGTSTAATLLGGTVNGGVRATAASNQIARQGMLGGNLSVNGGVFAYGNAELDVTGGSYTRFAGANASFFAMGTNTINFFGTDLALSGPTPGQVSDVNTFSGNFYTFTGGTFSDGQSATGLRLFDAVSLGSTQLGGGFTLNTAPVPEPSTALLLLLGLPFLSAAVRRLSAPA